MPITEGMSPEAAEHCDIAVVGGGILGLAVARELTARRPQASVCVLEREAELGTHQTGHNSGVIHAGVYYVPGSLKAQLCVAGAREMYAYCESKGIASERCGKVIVATDRYEVLGVSVNGRALRLRHSHGVTEARNAIFCAGAWADRLAVAAGADPDPRIVPFRGAYLRLRPERRELVRSLIYPVPDPALPFLGVHLTKHIDGDVLIGPTALLVAARDAYDLRRVRIRDVADTLAWPGTWRMAR